VDALTALIGKHPDLDLGRVAVRGAGLGGWLAGLAVCRRPEVFRCGVARDPVTDWSSLPAPLAERYLGRLADSPDVYAHHSLTDELPHPSLLVLDARAPLTEELEFLRAGLS
jgi:dipeptidyl-peptidase-4